MSTIKEMIEQYKLSIRQAFEDSAKKYQNKSEKMNHPELFEKLINDIEKYGTSHSWIYKGVFFKAEKPLRIFDNRISMFHWCIYVFDNEDKNGEKYNYITESNYMNIHK